MDVSCLGRAGSRTGGTVSSGSGREPDVLKQPGRAMAEKSKRRNSKKPRAPARGIVAIKDKMDSRRRADKPALRGNDSGNKRELVVMGDWSGQLGCEFIQGPRRVCST